jgi:hypothetical protein
MTTSAGVIQAFSEHRFLVDGPHGLVLSASFSEKKDPFFLFFASLFVDNLCRKYSRGDQAVCVLTLLVLSVGEANKEKTFKHEFLPRWCQSEV